MFTLDYVRFRRLALIFVIGVLLFDVIVDTGELLAGEYDDPLGIVHDLIEMVAVALACWLLVTEVQRSQRLRHELNQENERVQRLSGDMSDVIGRRFAEWSFSPAESEVGWLLIKGFSIGEIAELRGVREKTVRHQASAIYSKSGAESRSAFIAQFIEDLFADATRGVDRTSDL